MDWLKLDTWSDLCAAVSNVLGLSMDWLTLDPWLNLCAAGRNVFGVGHRDISPPLFPGFPVFFIRSLFFVK